MTATPQKVNTKPIRKISWIWFVPFITLLIGGWMLYSYMQTQGPLVTFTLKTAEGMEVGKTKIKARNVTLGVIQDITLSDDYGSIIATARMSPKAERMLKQDSQFWIVKPRIGAGGISGLDTLLSGAYIELQPGLSDKQSTSFNVLENPPVSSANSQGRRIVLEHNQAGKLKVGDPVLYEGFTVGRVEKVSFSTKDKKAHYGLFIFSPYDSLVKNRSKFWLTSGVDMKLNSDGVNIKIGSMETLMSGGVSFKVPNVLQKTEDFGKPHQQYPLYDSYDQVKERLYDNGVEYVMLFDESVRGLKVGAPIEYRGIKIGSVKKVPLQLLKSKESYHQKQIPVLVSIDIERIFDMEAQADLSDLQRIFDKQFNAGLRGTLATGSLITGALYVDVNFHDNTTYHQEKYGDYLVFPTTLGGVGQIQKQFTELISKMNALPLDQAVTSFSHAMKSTERSFDSFANVSRKLDALLAQKEVKDLPNDIQKTLIEVQKTVASYGPGTQVYNDAQATTQQLNQVTKELQSLLRQLNAQPNSLIMGDQQGQDPMPTKGAH